MKHLGDITLIKGSVAPVVDCIIGGSPCQDLSLAGKRAGLAGARSGLYMEQIRIIKEMREADVLRGRTDVDVRPRYMVWENVPGAFSTNGGKDFAAVLEEAIRVAEPEAPNIPVPEKGWPTSGCFWDELGKWSVAWRVLDAQFWGTSDKPLPQRRRRISLVADFGGLSAPEILFVRKSVSGNLEPGEQKRKEAPGDAGEGSGGAGESLVYGIGSYYSNAMKSDNPHSGIYVADTSKTLDALNCGYPGCNQGGMAVVQPMVMESVIDVEMEVAVRKYEVDCKRLCECLRGHKAASNFSNKDIAERLNLPVTLVEHWFRTDKSFAIPDPEVWDDLKKLLGIETTEFDQSITEFEFKGGSYDMRNRIHAGETSQTLTCACGNDLHLVSNLHKTLSYGIGNGQANQSLTEERVGALNCMHDQQAVLVPRVAGVDCRNATELPEMNATLQSDAAHNINSNNVVRVKHIVRRLTPLECERLQGFPDGWTDIGEWVDSKGKKHKEADSPRYKALGNSIAIPPWKWVLKRLCACYERDATMASLFDGIGGFPYIWEQLNGKGSCLWASEIEEFPMAVTKLRFGG